MQCNLADICAFRKDKVEVSSLNTSTYVSTESMLPNKGGIVESSSLPTSKFTQAFQTGDILVSNIRPYFKKIWLAEFNGGCSNDVLVFTANSDIDPYFLYYVLSADSFFSYATATAKGTKMPRGDRSSIMRYQFPLYDLATQTKIGNILSPLDDKIKLNDKICENLEQQVLTIYQEFFVTQRNQNWPLGTISDFGTIVGGGTPSKSNPEFYTSQGIAWITPKDLSIKKTMFISHGELDITDLGLKSSSAKPMPKGTVLFSSRAPIGYIAIASNEVTTNQGFKSIIPKPEIGTAFVYCFLKSNLSLIESYASGSTFKEISGGVMKGIQAIIPDVDTLNRFNSLCAPIFEQISVLERQNHSLALIRDSLLSKLMSGEIKVD